MADYYIHKPDLSIRTLNVRNFTKHRKLLQKKITKYTIRIEICRYEKKLTYNTQEQMAILNRMNEAEKERFRIKSLITNSYGEFSDEKVQKYMEDSASAFAEVGLDIVRGFKKDSDANSNQSS